MGLETVALKGLLYVAKMYAAMLVSLGGTAINSAGVQLGISSYSRPLTKMSFSETPINLCETILECKDGENSLIIIKEVIQHLPLNEGIKMLKNIKQSGIKYIAITNHDINIFNVNENINVDIGGFYPNNMFLLPFNFKNPLQDVNNIIPNVSEIGGYGNLIIFNIQEQNI